jgi:hypothetical protein
MESAWKTFLKRWNHIMRVVLLSMVLFISACTAPGRSISAPSGLSSEGGYTKSQVKGNGNGNGNGGM